MDPVDLHSVDDSVEPTPLTRGPVATERVSADRVATEPPASRHVAARTRASRLRRAGRRLALLAGWLAVLGSVVVTGARASGGDQHTPLVELAVLVPFAALALLGALVVAAGTRSPRLAVPAALLLAVQLVWLLPVFGVGIRQPAGLAGGYDVHVLEFNALTGLADPAAIAATVRERSIDVFAVEEITPQLARGLRDAGMAADLPYRAGGPGWGAGGTAIYSRWPLTDLGVLPGTTFGMPRAAVRLPNGTTITVTAVHTLSPLPARVAAWRYDLDTVHHAITTTAGPQVVLGDFNATRDHAAFRALLEGPDGLTDSSEAVGLLGGAWPGFTWPADHGLLPPPFMRLDHVLTTPDSIGVRGIDVLALPGSDHRALATTLTVVGR